MHLRHIAEKMGLIAETSATDAELLRTERGRSADLERTLDRYKRALLHVRVRAEQLHNNIVSCSQQGHEDLGIEVAQSAALADFAEHVCIEFEDDFTATTKSLNNSAPGADLPKTTGVSGLAPCVAPVKSKAVKLNQIAMEI